MIKLADITIEMDRIKKVLANSQCTRMQFDQSVVDLLGIMDIAGYFQGPIAATDLSHLMKMVAIRASEVSRLKAPDAPEMVSLDGIWECTHCGKSKHVRMNFESLDFSESHFYCGKCDSDWPEALSPKDREHILEGLENVGRRETERIKKLKKEREEKRSEEATGKP